MRQLSIQLAALESLSFHIPVEWASGGNVPWPAGDAVVDESLARLEEDKAESEALTASLRALLDVGDEHRESNSVTPSHGVEVETAADFTRFLSDFRGGF